MHSAIPSLFYAMKKSYKRLSGLKIFAHNPRFIKKKFSENLFSIFKKLIIFFNWRNFPGKKYPCT